MQIWIRFRAASKTGEQDELLDKVTYEKTFFKTRTSLATKATARGRTAALPLKRLMLSHLRQTHWKRTELKKNRLNVNRQSSMIIINSKQRRVQKLHRKILNTDLYRMNDLIPEVH